MMEIYDAILDHAMVSLETAIISKVKVSSSKCWQATYKTIPFRWKVQISGQCYYSRTEKGRVYDGEANVSF